MTRSTSAVAVCCSSASATFGGEHMVLCDQRRLALTCSSKLGPELLDRRGVVSHHDPPNAPGSTGDRRARLKARRRTAALSPDDRHVSSRTHHARERAYDGEGTGRCDVGHRSAIIVAARLLSPKLESHRCTLQGTARVSGATTFR